MKLDALQRWFWAVTTAPEGAEKALADGVGAEHLGGRDPLAVVCGDGALTAIRRLDLYANMYFFRLRDILAGDFGALACVLGEARFHNLVTDYLIAHPSRDANVARVGRSLPQFLRSWRGLCVAWWPALAELEWARAEVFDRPDHDALPLGALTALAPELWPTLRLRWAPATTLLVLDADIDAHWHAARADREDGGQRLAALAEPDGASFVLVSRVGTSATVTHERLDVVQWTAVRHSRDGASFADVMEALCRVVPEDEAPAAAARAVVGWVQRGWIAGIQVDDGGATSS